MEGLYWTVGFSGHGFKLSPVVGHMVAELVIPGESRGHPVSRFERGNVKLIRYFMRYSLLIRLVIYGGPIILAATLWAWAIGVNVWYGFVPGVVLGLLVSFLLDAVKEGLKSEGGLADLGRLAIGGYFILLFLAISIVGAIVGVVLRIF